MYWFFSRPYYFIEDLTAIDFFQLISGSIKIILFKENLFINI